MGFGFDRSGVGIPTLAISAWIPERTVVTEEHRATSLLATMRERWNLGPPLTARDASARSFTNLFTLDKPRAPDQWPDLVARPVPPGPQSMLPLDAPLGLLGRALVFGVLALGKGMGVAVPDLAPDTPLTGAQEIDAAQHVLAELFPRLQEDT
jgi:phospholipase C